jgi:hypothetical protein
MKRAKFVLPLLALLALGFVLSGCPKDKMMGDNTPRTVVERIG